MRHIEVGMEKILKTEALQIEYGTVVLEENLSVLKCKALEGARAPIRRRIS